jgi:hypothetical protein
MKIMWKCIQQIKENNEKESQVEQIEAPVNDIKNWNLIVSFNYTILIRLQDV